MNSSAFAQKNHSLKRNFYNRAEIVAKIIDALEIKNKKADFIKACMQNRNDCFFVFSIISNYQRIKLDPLILYPDVSAPYRYYDEINIATMLGLIHGHIMKNTTPFKPRNYMTRIHVLKVLMGAAEMLNWQEKFELKAELGSEKALKEQKISFKDIDMSLDYTWWYARYLNLALKNGIIIDQDFFRPDEYVTITEFENMLNRTLKIINHDS